MKNVFDYTKHSVQEYSDLLRDLFNGLTPTIHFNDTLVSTEVRNIVNKNMILTFESGACIRLDSTGWLLYAQSNDKNSVDYGIKNDRSYYMKDGHFETLNFDNVGFTKRHDGMSNKKVFLKNSTANLYKNRVVINVNGIYTFSVEYFKKYKEYSLSTHCGMTYYEKVSYTSGTLMTTLRVENRQNNAKYSIAITKNSKTKVVEMSMYKNFSPSSNNYIIKSDDASIDSIFNKYIMFDFDFTSTPEDYTIVDNVRSSMKSSLTNVYNELKSIDSNTSIIHNALMRIGEMEDDEYQIQKRKA